MKTKLTFTSKIYASENPIFLGEYNKHLKTQIFNRFWLHRRLQNKLQKRQAKSHFFSKFVKNFNNDDGSESNLNITIQDVSNDKYLKLYKIDTNLADTKLII